MSTPREHVEKIRRERFYIGREERNPLAEDIHQAVSYLSEELYSKDVHFLMELIQNAEDNKYPTGVAPSLEFVVTSKDITGTGATSTLLVFNNEMGFSPANINSICRIGKSTKKGCRHRGYIGEKGIGFKSVFLISSQPHIFSNGYQIKFNEEPSAECDVGYIVPEWVENSPTVSDLEKIYGSSKPLPTTTIILPLKAEKVIAVKKQLSSIHPEILLFLSKIRCLSVREDNDDPKLSTVSQVSISSEANYQMRKNIDAESFTLHLSAQENGQGGEEECTYYMWKQKFPVKSECRVKKRIEVDEWIITLAFPFGQRLNRGMRLPGVYAFLPTEMVTNLPFIIQADFLLAASRESILFDSPWNKGILDCVPTAFVSAFVALVKSIDTAPAFSLPSMFNFLPVNASSIPLLDSVRLSIKNKVAAEHIVPCASYTAQKIFCKPTEVGRLFPAFWDILNKAQKSGVDLQNLSSHGTYVLSSYFDGEEYDNVLNFLGVGYVDCKWYGKCIEGSNLVKEASEEIYLDLLCFIADNWDNYFHSTNIQNIPLLKFVNINGGLSFWSIYRTSQWNEKICIASGKNYISWLIEWNRELASASGRYFMPPSTQTCLETFYSRGTVLDWLQKSLKVEVLSPYKYGLLVVKSLTERRLVIIFTHFLYHSLSKKYISELYINELCSSMPLVDNYGSVVTQRTQILVPAKGSKWVGLMGSNPWRGEKYVELGADYMSVGTFAGNYTSDGQLLMFLKTHTQANDVPYICPPNADFPTVSSPLTMNHAFLLLEWIRNLKSREILLPEKFLKCIKNGSWLKTSIGYKPPSESFLSSAEWGSLLQIGSVLVDIPMIDQEFYGLRISNYKEELRAIGVRFEFGEASTYIGKHLMSMAANNTLTRTNVFSLLQLIRFLRQKHLSPEYLIKSIKDGNWLKTSHGYTSPVGSIFFDSDWRDALYISSLPFIDTKFYGEDILDYKTELELLGVLVSFKHNYKLLVDNFKFSTSLITADATILILDCIRFVSSSESFIKQLKVLKWIKTNLGFKAPHETFLGNSEWECLLKVVDDVPQIDLGYYGDRINSYQEELKKVGVVVRFEEASKAIAHKFKLFISTSLVSKRNVLALLAAYRQICNNYTLAVDLLNCMRSEKWLHTSLGFRSPTDCILYNSEWESISPIANLPFIDMSDSYNGLGREIYEYRKELKALGVAIGLKDGTRFVVTGLNIPKNPSVMTTANVFSLLNCIRNLKESRIDIPKELMNRMSKKWLKTVMGYKLPVESILFDSKWSSLIHKEDGPFIDEAFYGSAITSYKDELKDIGVVVDVSHGFSLIARYLKCHLQSTAICRVYKYLKEIKWEPDNKSEDWIWIPSGNDGGQWVTSRSCILHDKHNLFGSQLHVLEKHYEKDLLGFFSMSLDVRHGPTVEDYCKLWSIWASSNCQPTVANCSAVWEFIAKHWNATTERLLSQCATKLPVCTKNGILLSNKQDVFIPDDLLLKDLFDKASEDSLFIWYPSSNQPSTSRAKMNCIYSSIGVQKISEAVEKDESYLSEVSDFRTIDPRDTVIKNGLLQIVLAFLANPSLDICAEKRHEIAGYLLGLTVLETDDPILVSYKVALSSGRTLAVKASRMFRWEREKAKLLMQTIDRSSEKKGRIEFATYFSEEISQGLLFETADQIASLTELVKLGCLLDFEEAAVDFLLKTKNLQLFAEDEEFLLSSALSSTKV
ncbi:uncharacterized protein [Typha angustifolia]|uniref:uncharacterized protein n=1 Tax=Typha angustifolia TaxID=59011 RepID=UPI003C2ACA04